ncbi:MAG: 30S ribosomal protein S14 type Z [Candidatus Firestonebacteria bacterium GWA2_43_8]|nr:MAG: 30S ribosomal protein S14 type Z [Candidatus Firestonebacteria bacterium GWA2_43_8]
MAKTSWIVKNEREPKYKTRKYNRCKICGRRRGYYRKFGVCRICFRKLAQEGKIPGVRKASW